MKALLAFVAGVLFAAGLALSGMTIPAKVVGFLDVTGGWDPSLAFVMGGALATYALCRRFIVQRRTPLLDRTFHLPTERTIDHRLLAGAAIFGVGWGLGGFCPGPGLVSAGAGTTGALVFVAGMTGGMLAEKALSSSRRTSS